MNMQNLMAQAQKLQKEIKAKQAEIDATIFEGKSEWVLVTMNGKREIQSINIKKDLLNDEDDLEMLEDMIKIAFNDALNKIEEEIQSKMGMYGDGLAGMM